MNDLTISIDPKGNKPLYEQIYDHLKREMLKGRLLPGERLPSTRALAKYLQVSRSTAELSYAQLLSEGYIESIPYKGYYVSQLEGLCEIKQPQFTYEENVKSPKKSYQFDFALNGIDANGFPHNTWRKLSKRILDFDQGDLFQLGDSRGEWSLRNTLSNYLHYARGVECTPNQIIVGAGNDYLLMLLSVILDKESLIAMENPTYLSAYRAFSNLGFQVDAIDVDEVGINMERLKSSKAKIAYVMPSHQFPMGTVMNAKRRLQLLKWANEQQGYIIEDDYDSEFRYKGKPIPALQGLDHHDRVIYLGTFSKSIAPAIRISYMVLPNHLLPVYEKKASNFSVTVSKVDQKILRSFLEEGFFERHLNRMRGIYKSKHDCLVNELKQLGEHIEVYGEHAGVHLRIKVKAKIKEQELVETLKNEDLRVYGLSEYYIQRTKEEAFPTILMGYATLDEKKIPQSISIFKKVIEKFLRIH